MRNRREFLKTAAAGAALLGSSATVERLGLAATPEGRQHQGGSKVVVAHDANVHGANGQLDETRVLALLDRAIASYTGVENSVAAWKRIVPVGKVIGLKVNGLGGKGIATHAVLTLAICERLQQAGVKPSQIVIFEQRTRFLEACGFQHRDNPGNIRMLSSEIYGYEPQLSSHGSATIRLAKALTLCDMVIGIPILKDHSMAGVTFAMKNMYGVVDRPEDLHATGCSPAVADLNCIPAIRNKVRFTIGDAMTSVYDGGPGFHPERLWQPNSLVVGMDRVAVDTIAWQMIAKKRAEVGMPTLEAVGRPPRYIAVAADAAHRLGTNDPKRIHLMEV